MEMAREMLAEGISVEVAARISKLSIDKVRNIAGNQKA